MKFIYKLIFIFGIVVLLSAFGCKNTLQKETANKGSNESKISANTLEAVNETVANEANSPLNSKSQKDSTNQTVEKNTEESNQVDKSKADSKTETDKTKTKDSEDEIRQLAEKMAEIFGTYTNKDKEPYRNLKELKEYSTARMQNWLDKESSRPQNKGASFYGVTTKALSSTVLELNQSSAKVLVTTKREEIQATTKLPKTSYKLILIEFVKENEEWKLDGMYWQE